MYNIEEDRVFKIVNMLIAEDIKENPERAKFYEERKAIAEAEAAAEKRRMEAKLKEQMEYLGLTEDDLKIEEELTQDDIPLKALEELEAILRENEKEYDQNLIEYMRHLEEESEKNKRYKEHVEGAKKPPFKNVNEAAAYIASKKDNIINVNFEAPTLAEEDPGQEIWAMIDTEGYKGSGDDFKNTVLKNDASTITGRIRLRKVTIKDLVEYASTGHAIRPGTFTKKGNKVTDNFKGIQALFIDVDEGHSAKDSLKIAKENNINVAAIVPTVRYTVENQKHRIILVLNKPLYDGEVALTIINGLINLFKSDGQCKNLKRYYFGSCNKPLYTDYAATNDIEYLKDLTNGIKDTKNDEVKTAETVDITGLEAAEKSTFETTPILNLCNNNYKINMGGELNDIYKDGAKLDESMLDRLFKDEIFVKSYGFKSFNSMGEIKSYLKSIPLEHLLQIDHPSSFKCIIHDDNTPSAAIKMMDNTSVYTCFADGCIGTCNDIFNIVSYVLCGSTDRFIEAFNYIVEILELDVKDVDLKFYKRISEIIKKNRYLALTSNKLGEEFKNVRKKLESKYTNMLVRTLMDVAEYTLDCCPQLSKAEDLIFTASASFLKDRAGFSSQKMIGERIDDLVAIGFIEQLTDDEVKRINRNVYNSVMSLQKKNFYGKAKTINCYRLKRVDTKALAEAEKGFKYSKQKGATRKGTSATQNMVTGISARRKANETRKNKEIFKLLEAWFTRTYNRNKYVLKDLYLNYAAKNNIGEKKASEFISTFTSELGLVSKKVSKELIKKFNIPKTKSRKTVFI